MVAPTFDGSVWPLYRVRLRPEGMTEQEFIAYLDHVDALFLRNDPFALMIDARDAPPHTPTERREIARHMHQSFRRFPLGMVAVAVVLGSRIQRGAFTAITWLTQATFPTRAFATVSAAEQWLQEMLRARAH